MRCAALAVAGKPLWDRFDNGDNLLFRESDLANPAGSTLFRALWDLDDPTVTNLIALLIVSAQRPIGDTPWLDEVLSGDESVPVSDAVLAYTADTLRVPRRTARTPLAVAQIYVVPQEANEFTELGGRAGVKGLSRGLGLGAAMIAAGCVLVAAAVIVVALVTRGKPSTGVPDDTGNNQQAQAPPQDDRIQPPDSPPVKTGIVETQWTPIAAGPPIHQSRALIAGIDIAPPASKIVRTFRRPGVASLGAWFLPDGRHALVAGRKELALLDLHSGQLLPMPHTAGDWSRALVGPDLRHAILAALDNSIHCIDLEASQELWSQNFPGPIGALAITADGQRVIATADKIGYIEWAVEKGNALRKHELLQASSLAMTADGKLAIAAADDGVELWSLDDAKTTPLAPKLRASAVCVSADGNLAVAAVDQSIKSWDLSSGQPRTDRPSPIKTPIVSMAMTTEGVIVVGNQAGEIGMVGRDEPATITLEPAGPVATLGLTTDGQHGLFATDQSSPVLCRVGDLVRPFGPSRTGPMVGCLEVVRSAEITPEQTMFAADARGQHFLAASASRLTIYDATKFEKTDSFQVVDGKVVAAGFGPNSTVVICKAKGDEFDTRSYDLKKQEPGKIFAIPDIELKKISRILPVYDRPWVLATTDPAGDVLFDPETGEPVEGWPTPRASEPAVAIPGPLGRRIAIGRPENPVRLWDCETMRLGPRCEASSGVNALAFTPDGTKLIGLWTDGRIRIWDSVTGNFIKEVDHEYPGPFSELSAIANDIIVLTTTTGRVLMNIDTGKVLNLGDGPDPLSGRGIAVPKHRWMLLTDGDEHLTAWQIDPKVAAKLPAQPPPPSPWPEIALVRSLPPELIAGITYDGDSDNVLIAWQTGKLSRYSADRLLYVNEFDTREPPMREMVSVGNRLYFLTKRSNVIERDAKSLNRIEEFTTAAPMASIPSLFVVQPDGSHFLLVVDKLRLTDTKRKKDVATALAPRGAAGKLLTQFAYSADGKIGVARWGDAVMAMWHPSPPGSAKILENLKTPVPAAPHALALTPDGKIAILGTGDGRITAWDTKTKAVLHKEDVYPAGDAGNAITTVAVFPDGSRFITVGLDGRVILWELPSFKKLKEFHGREGVWQLAIAPTGKSFVMVQPGYIQRIDLPDPAKREP